MFTFRHRGDLKKTETFLTEASKLDLASMLEKYGRMGVDALASATPVETGEAARAWGFDITVKKGRVTLAWTNYKMAGSVPVVILIQYGHATGNGGYVRGRDFINPALRPIFDQLAEDAWKEVTKL